MSHRTLTVVCVMLLLAGVEWIIIEPPAAVLQIALALPSPDSDSDSGAQDLDLYLQTQDFGNDGLFPLGQLLMSGDPGNPSFPIPPNRIPRSPPTA